MELEPKTFTGLLIPDVPIKPADYKQGDPANPLGALGARVLNPTGKWKGYHPPIQLQLGKKGFESMNCTAYAYCRKVATDLNYMWRNNLLAPEFITWARSNGYIQNESFMFDPQVLGIVAGTTSSGNWLQVVADFGRKFGLLPAGTLPGPDAYAPNDYAGYYNKALITDAMRNLGQEFLKWVDLPYQWRTQDNTSEDAALKACSLYSALCTCGGWNNPPVAWCNAGDASNHAVGQIDDQQILDSYNPDIKDLAGNYNIPYQMMVLTTAKKPQPKTTGYKKANSPTVYVKLDSGMAVPVADWNAFLSVGGSSNTVKTLSDAEFEAMLRADNVLFKSK